MVISRYIVIQVANGYKNIFVLQVMNGYKSLHCHTGSKWL